MQTRFAAAENIISVGPWGWRAIHLCLITAAHAMSKGGSELAALARLGEEWVAEFEQRRLHDEERRPDLAKRVEWIADTRGDGAGYDIASFNPDASPRLIEVKTTGLGKQFPFMVTANEVRVSEREPEGYHLYRVFEFAKAPRLYVLHGSLSERCQLEAIQYRARP